MTRAALCIATVLISGLLSGCRRLNISFLPEPERELSAWVADEMTNLTDRTPPTNAPDVYDAEARTVKLFGAANETLCFQLVIEAGPEGESGLELAWTDLTAGKETIPAAHVSAFRMMPVRVEEYPPWHLRLTDAPPRPATFYDALAPIDAPKAGQPFALKPGERLALWVDVSIPRGAHPGAYTGTLSVRARNSKPWRLTMRAQVYDFVLPDTRPLAAVGGFDHRDVFSTLIQRDGEGYIPPHLDRRHPLVIRGLTAMRQLMQLAHRHRLDLFEKGIRPVVKRDMFGKVQVDWTDYDAIVMPYLKGTAFEDGIGAAAWPTPFCEDWPQPRLYGGPQSEAYLDTAGQLAAECRRRLAADPEIEGRLFTWPYRGPVTGAGYATFARLARIALAADGKTPVLSRLPARPPGPTGWVAPADMDRLATIQAPPAQWLRPYLAADMRDAARPLQGMWLSPGTPPYLGSLGVIASPADVRAVPWFAMKYRCTGLFLPEVLHWGGPDASEAEARTRLFHPGTPYGIEGAVPSVRLKRLRRGLQDLAYLWLLSQRERDAVARAMLDSMARYAGLAAMGDNYLDPRLDGWVRTPATWRLARRLLAEEVTDAIHPSDVPNRRLSEQRLAWQHFNAQVHRVRVEQVRCGVAPIEHKDAAGSETARRLRAVIYVDLYNEHAREVDCQLSLGDLPEGWKDVGGAVKVASFPPATRKTVTLSAEGDSIPTGPDGRLPLPVRMVTDMRDARTLNVRAAFLLSGVVDQPIAIDGELDDWPMRFGNSAADFRLIGRRGRLGDGLATRRTSAFVLHDAENLYIAFRCAEPTPERIVARASNVIRYEQLMAHGEDLVEVVLDPGAGAKGPQDLFHLIVKANGVLVASRGVQTRPPLGRSEPWPSGAAVAVGRQDGHWIVEMAIPRKAFGERGQADLWRVNFARFATRGGEASNWAGAPRYLYDPRSLGAMFVRAVSPAGK